MGNKISLSSGYNSHLPSSTNVKDLSIINEYFKCRIANILETYEYWLDSDFSLRPTLTRNAFEDVFGNLVKDSDVHFSHFLISQSKIQELIQPHNVSQQYDSTQQITIHVCETLEVLTTIILYSADSIKIKVHSIFNINDINKRNKDNRHKNEIKLTRDQILIMFQRILSGSNRFFNIKQIDTTTLEKIIDDLLKNYFDLNHTFKKNPKRNDVQIEDHSEKTLNFKEFWQLCQDSKILWEFLINVNECCKSEKLRDRISDINMSTVKPFLIEIEKTPRFDDNDYEEYQKEEELSIESLVNQINSPKLTQISLEKSFIDNNAIDNNPIDKIFLTDKLNRNHHPLWSYSILDMINDSWLKPLPLIGSEDMIFTALEHIILFSKSAIPVFLREKPNDFINEINSNNKQSNQIIKSDIKIHDFIGIIDSFTILAWLIEACPSQITDSVEMIKTRKWMNGPNKYRVADTSLNIYQISAKFSGTTQRVRDNITNNGKVTSNKWQDIGEIVALSNVRLALNGKYVQSLPKYHKSQTLLTDNFAYDVILKVAQGFKAIPVSTNSAHPYKPNQLLTLLEVVDFIHKFCSEILGKKRMNLPVENTGMIKKAHTVNSSTIFGTCISLMVAKNTDCVAILDEKGKFGGRLDSSLLEDMWFQWYEHTVHDQTSDRECTLDALKNDYQSGLYKMYDGTNQTFSVFSIIFSPLKFYDKVIITDFDLMLCGDNKNEEHDHFDTDTDSDDSENDSSDLDEKESIADTDCTTDDDNKKSKKNNTTIKSNMNEANNIYKSQLNNPVNITKTTKKGILLPEKISIKAKITTSPKKIIKAENKKISMITKQKQNLMKPEVINFELVILFILSVSFLFSYFFINNRI